MRGKLLNTVDSLIMLLTQIRLTFAVFTLAVSRLAFYFYMQALYFHVVIIAFHK